MLSRRPSSSDLRQDELPLASVLAHARFPGRSTLYLREVAEALSIDLKQVLNLIVGGELEAVCISLRSATSAGMTQEEREGVNRTHWRVTVSGYDAFLRARTNDAIPQPQPNQP